MKASSLFLGMVVAGIKDRLSITCSKYCTSFNSLNVLCQTFFEMPNLKLSPSNYTFEICSKLCI